MGMDGIESTPAFIDNGNAPEFFANGLHDVEVMGSVCRFVLYLVKRRPDGSFYREATLTVIMPRDAIGPGIALTVHRLGGAVVPAIGTAARMIIKDMMH